jgi:hypothetical protein
MLRRSKHSKNEVVAPKEEEEFYVIVVACGTNDYYFH